MQAKKGKTCTKTHLNFSKSVNNILDDLREELSHANFTIYKQVLQYRLDSLIWSPQQLESCNWEPSPSSEGYCKVLPIFLLQSYGDFQWYHRNLCS